MPKAITAYPPGSPLLGPENRRFPDGMQASSGFAKLVRALPVSSEEACRIGRRIRNLLMCVAAKILRCIIEDLRRSITGGYDRPQVGEGRAAARDSRLFK
jgi:hypothetical protein